jgi:sortase (surface protein transpeptidase)
LGDVKSRKEKRPTQILWWAVSLALVLAGILGIVFVPRSQPTGPTLTSSLGVVSLPPSGVVIPSPTTATTTTTIPVTPALSAPTTTTTIKQASSVAALVTSERPTERTSRLAHAKKTTPTYVAKPIPRSRPVHLTIPIIGVSVPLSVLTLNKDGTVNVPTNFSEPGWYNGDRSPGQKGSAVILGHVDNFHGPAIFFYLDKLKLGNHVNVTLKDGRKLVFAVIGIRQYQKTNFPDKLVYGTRTYPALQLVTCGGIFDPATGHYLSNIVVFTALIKS